MINRRCLVYENITDYLKNHWTKHRLVRTHFDAFSILIPNMGIIFNNSDIFSPVFKFSRKTEVVVCIQQRVKRQQNQLREACQRGEERMDCLSPSNA